MKNRIISFLLALLMLSMFIVGCAESKTETDESESAEQTKSESSETVREHKVPTDKLDFEDATFNFLYPEWQEYVEFFFVEEGEENIDTMTEAIYKRKCKVEDDLGVKLTQDN